MGQVDLEKLFEIYYETLSIAKKYNLPYRFKVDEGTYETALEFFYDDDEKWHTAHPPLAKNWIENPTIICPDLLDYKNKLIIEYEEEVGERKTGAKLAKKGHNREGDIDTKRDERRNKYYRHGKFTVLQIWESDECWRKKLKIFLCSLNGVQ